VAERFGLPWLVVRAISDRAGDESVIDFRTFLATAAGSSARLVRSLLPVLAA
jgi:adenosylhomocysteine nucleosidase